MQLMIDSVTNIPQGIFVFIRGHLCMFVTTRESENSDFWSELSL